MKVHVLFGQRVQRYEGEYDLEALAVMSQADLDSNPDYLPAELDTHRKAGEFAALAIVTLEVPRQQIREILFPAAAPVAARVVGQIPVEQEVADRPSFEESRFHDAVVVLGRGAPQAAAYTLARTLFEAGRDYAAIAAEVVTREMVDPEI